MTPGERFRDTSHPPRRECPGGTDSRTGEPARCRPGGLRRWRGEWLCPNCWSRERRRADPGPNREAARRFNRDRWPDRLDYQRRWRAENPGYDAEASRRSRGANVGGDTRDASE